MSNGEDSGSVNEEEQDDPSTERPIERPLNLADSYELGANIHYLILACKHNYPLGGVNEGGVLSSLESIQNKLVQTNTLTNVAQQIYELKMSIHEEYEGKPTTTPIDGDMADRVQQQARTWNELISNVIVDERRVPIPRQGILDWALLVDNPGAIFDDGVWENMDATPKNDIAEACSVMAMRCTTASVMVALRAVEHYLRKWYEVEVGEDIGRGTWGSVLGDLIDRYVEEQDRDGPVLQQLSGVPSILSNLHYLKEKRDKVNHPDESPTSYDAVITLFMVAGTISEIVVELGEVQTNQ